MPLQADTFTFTYPYLPYPYPRGHLKLARDPLLALVVVEGCLSGISIIVLGAALRHNLLLFGGPLGIPPDLGMPPDLGIPPFGTEQD
jgi:hypothetical protein